MKKKVLAVIVAGAVMLVGTAGAAIAKPAPGGCKQTSTGSCKR